MTTLRYRCWVALAKPMIAADVAQAIGEPPSRVVGAINGLIMEGHAVRLSLFGHRGIYQATDKRVLPEGRGKSPGSQLGRAWGPKTRPKVHRLKGARKVERPIENGYGRGRIALEEVWR